MGMKLRGTTAAIVLTIERRVEYSSRNRDAAEVQSRKTLPYGGIFSKVAGSDLRVEEHTPRSKCG